MEMNFKQLKEVEDIRKLREFEKDFSKLPEVGFKIPFNIQEENFAERLMEGLQ